MAKKKQTREELRKNIETRLKKIEGQIRGVRGMVAEEKECEQILNQVRAAQSALKSVSGLVLKVYLLRCQSDLLQESLSTEAMEKMEATVDLITKFIDS